MRPVVNKICIIITQHTNLFLNSENKKIIQCKFRFGNFTGVNVVKFNKKFFKCFLYLLAYLISFNIIEVFNFGKIILIDYLFFFRFKRIYFLCVEPDKLFEVCSCKIFCSSFSSFFSGRFL